MFAPAFSSFYFSRLVLLQTALFFLYFYYPFLPFSLARRPHNDRFVLSINRHTLLHLAPQSLRFLFFPPKTSKEGRTAKIPPFGRRYAIVSLKCFPPSASTSSFRKFRPSTALLSSWGIGIQAGGSPERDFFRFPALSTWFFCNVAI